MRNVSVFHDIAAMFGCLCGFLLATGYFADKMARLLCVFDQRREERSRVR